MRLKRVLDVWNEPDGAVSLDELRSSADVLGFRLKSLTVERLTDGIHSGTRYTLYLESIRGEVFLEEGE